MYNQSNYSFKVNEDSSKFTSSQPSSKPKSNEAYITSNSQYGVFNSHKNSSTGNRDAIKSSFVPSSLHDRTGLAKNNHTSSFTNNVASSYLNKKYTPSSYTANVEVLFLSSMKLSIFIKQLYLKIPFLHKL